MEIVFKGKKIFIEVKKGINISNGNLRTNYFFKHYGLYYC